MKVWLSALFLSVLLFPLSEALACCKICTTGKACGNSCISRSFTCHQPPGCACNSGGGSGGGSTPRPTPRPSPKPKYSRTSGALLLNDIQVLDGVKCGFFAADGVWRAGRVLRDGKFLSLKTEIRNVGYLANFYSGSKRASFNEIKSSLQKSLKKKGPVCKQLG